MQNLKIYNFNMSTDFEKNKNTEKWSQWCKADFSQFSPFSSHFFEITIPNNIVDLKIVHHLDALRIQKFLIVFEL